MRKLRNSESKHLACAYTSDGGPSNPGRLRLRSTFLSLRVWALGVGPGDTPPGPLPCPPEVLAPCATSLTQTRSGLGSREVLTAEVRFMLTERASADI